MLSLFQLNANHVWSKSAALRCPATVAGVNLTFADNNPLADTITRAAGNFINDGYQAGDQFVVTLTANNNHTFTIGAGGVAAGVLTLVSGDALVNEGPGVGTITALIPPVELDLRSPAGIPPSSVIPVNRGAAFTEVSFDGGTNWFGLRAYDTDVNHPYIGHPWPAPIYHVALRTAAGSVGSVEFVCLKP